MPPKAKLGQPPKFFRASIARGLASKKDAPPIDPTGGNDGCGIIRGMAICTRGEALGHDLWIDNEFLDQIAEQMNASAAGIKARFTHPGLSSDGLGTYTGRVTDGTVDGDVCRGDLHISQAACDTPDGNLGDYLLKLAASDPAAFGNSIVFDHDYEAERNFMVANGGKGDGGSWYQAQDGFQSPDPLNVENFPHARLKALRAVDAVDQPAANPSGLFHRGDKAAADAEALMAFSLGLSAERPDLTELDVDPDRFGAFVSRFLDRHKLSIISTEPKMPDPAPNPTPLATPPSAPPTGEPTPPIPAVEKLSVSNPTPPAQKTGADFLTAFGDQGGVWFAQGKSFDEATQLHTAAQTKRADELATENAKLKAQLAARTGETTPLSGNTPRPDEKTPDQAKLTKLKQAIGSEGLARFAAAITLPTKN